MMIFTEVIVCKSRELYSYIVTVLNHSKYYVMPIKINQIEHFVILITIIYINKELDDSDNIINYDLCYIKRIRNMQ